MARSVEFGFVLKLDQRAFHGGMSGMHFYRWLPIGEKHRIEVNEPDAKRSLRIWFEPRAWGHGNEPPPSSSEIKRWPQAGLELVRVDVCYDDLSDELYDGIREWSDEERKRLRDEQLPSLNSSIHSKFCFELCTFVARYLNRFVAYVRDEIGQWWLEEYYFTLDNMTPLLANAFYRKPPDSDWTRWNPPIGVGLVAEGPQKGRSIRADQWSEVRRAVVSGHRPSLAGSYLAEAEAQFSNGWHRMSVVAATTALEIALNRFGRSFPQFLAGRGFSGGRENNNGINICVELGLRSSTQTLLPLVFDESELRQRDVDLSYEAIEARNNIVHRGQREIDTSKVKEWIAAIRMVCGVLEEFRSEFDSY